MIYYVPYHIITVSSPLNGHNEVELIACNKAIRDYRVYVVVIIKQSSPLIF